MLLGTTVRLSRKEVLQRAREASVAHPTGAHRFETWYVALDADEAMQTINIVVFLLADDHELLCYQRWRDAAALRIATLRVE